MQKEREKEIKKLKSAHKELYLLICKRRTESAGFSKQILNYLMFSFVCLLV